MVREKEISHGGKDAGAAAKAKPDPIAEKLKPDEPAGSQDQPQPLPPKKPPQKQQPKFDPDKIAADRQAIRNATLPPAKNSTTSLRSPRWRHRGRLLKAKSMRSERDYRCWSPPAAL